MTESISKVQIRPESSILTVLSHLNYKPWYAIAEFVDNSIQSYQANKEILRKLHGKSFKLKIEIKIDKEKDCIEIVDNAAGLYTKDYQRAFRAAALPENNTGLSEFGMGMKSAACWFTWNWSVRSKAIGEDVERSVWFDVKKISENNTEILPVTEIKTNVDYHYTVIRLETLGSKFPILKTYTKIRDHLTSIYRMFLRTDEIEIYFGDSVESLIYEDPKILTAPPADGSSNIPIYWRREITFDIDAKRKVNGFVAIRQEGSTSHAGLALFRRGRLIYGSDDETYRPEEIFGKSNDFRYQRIFGELTLEGFDVSHTKDGFDWGDCESIFIEKLKSALKDTPPDFSVQAAKHRARPTKKQLQKPVSAEIKNIKKALSRPETIKELDKNLNPKLSGIVIPRLGLSGLNTDESINEEFRVSIDGNLVLVRVLIDTSPISNDWISIRNLEKSEYSKAKDGLEITLYVAHPVISGYLGTENENLGFLIRLAVSLGLAEQKSQKGGMPTTLFHYWLNRIMKEVDLNG